VEFLHGVQLSELGEPEHAGSIDGAFPLTEDSDMLRSDVTAHALLALLDAARAGLTQS
jgi:hypothetical protein